MMVAGYEHEGFVIPDEESKDYIWKKVRGNKNRASRIYVGCDHGQQKRARKAERMVL